jgi:predicted transposase YdaD
MVQVKSGGRAVYTKMAKRRPRVKALTQEQQQPYDNLLKSLLEGQEEHVIHYFLTEAVYVETLHIEIMRTLLRVDRVYKVRYKGEIHILHLEFETGTDPTMAARLLDYHAYLYHKYKLPVISVIVYPFRTTMATSPLEETSDGKQILIFHFRIFPLWKLSAEKYIREHAVAMYALLPAMDGANAHLLSQAIDEMVQYYQDNKIQLARELRWLGIVLRRADIVSVEEKRKVEERLNMYDDLMEKDPKMQKIRAESEARGEAKGEAKGISKGRTEGLQTAILVIVKGRFPSLFKMAKQSVRHISTNEELSNLLAQIAVAPDETAARLLLTPDTK